MNNEKVFNAKKYFFIFLTLIVSFMIIVCGLNIIVDPYFHYHSPLGKYGYELNSGVERYINDGILKNYDYNALIIGNSMVQNFKTSQFDEIFGVNSIKKSSFQVFWFIYPILAWKDAFYSLLHKIFGGLSYA